MSASLLPVIAVVLVSGLAVQLLAHRLKVPSVIFYLLIGVVLGPELLGLLTLDTFGDGLEIIVGISVAIIVFEGAFALQIDRIRGASTVSFRLVTVGALVMFLGTAAAVRFFEGASWEISLLIGALLVATGPTVITPILNVVRVRDHVATALETEGIVNDVTAAIVAVVIFETLLLDDLGVPATVLSFFQRFGVGVGAGVLATVTIYVLLHSDFVPERDVQASQFLVLAAAVGAFAAAEAVAAEAGIAAAATSGIILGNIDLKNREEIEQFTENATVIVLSFVFISLAALIDVDAILQLGVGAIAIVLTIMLVLRPLGALIATFGVERFTWPERLFIAGVGPRGIIPASVATLFAIELELAGNVEAGQLLVGTVFAVIIVTVAVEAGLARQIGDALGVSPMRTIIIGGGRVGRALATRLENRGEFVVLVESDADEIEAARSEGFTVYEGDGTDTQALRRAGIEDAKRFITATRDDDINLLACQLAITTFGIEAVYSQVNEPENVDAFRSIGVTAVDSPTATAVAIDDEIERPAITHWMNELGDSHDVQEVEVTSEEFTGKSIEELNSEIPDGCFIAIVSRDGENDVPSADRIIEHGDRLTFVGDTGAVRRAMNRFHPHD
ncbi:Kef-type transport system [Natronomonas moolapensis 8.8.11]|uniref:Kef-type transport system n=1 Tax=Natronomonas moolapensis (strain DSM 18674 / CECT 7526 / JCM 14361 / 8.8.11) TaxID=268739 RepID=M1XQ35_NATM8|nr:Kef-type transport system [Natronomonas moolapensis]CCQ36176.1 Kef-type transport system [Natronomonas moolapensis 8.8.11]